MAWIELHQTLPTNKKTMRLESLLKAKTPQVIGHLCMLWLWAIDNAQDGNLKDFLPAEIAKVAGWDKSPEIFIDALRMSGFVDRDMRIHDWDEYIGKLIEKRKTDAERKRTSRGRTTNNSGMSAGHPTDIQQTSAENPCDGAGNRTAPYPTVPNRTNNTPTSVNIDIHGDADVTDDKDLKAVSEFYTKSCGKLLSSALIADIQQFLKAGADTSLIDYALGVSLNKNNVASYFRGVMHNKIASGILTYQQLIEVENAGKLTAKAGIEVIGNPFLQMLKDEGES